MVGGMDSRRRRLRLGLARLGHHLARWRRQPEHPMPPPHPVGETGSPLAPVYPFNEPGQAIVLYDGVIGGLAGTGVPGVVELSCALAPNLAWKIKPGEGTGMAGSEVTLLLNRPEGDVQLPGVWRDSGEGWSNGAEIGKADAPLKRIIAHWFNVPDFHAQAGRWETETAGWKVTLDARPDHGRVWRELHRTDVYVMTHVMELRRADGATFTAAEAEPVLAGLHVGVSFALGRWAAPMLPAGEGANGEIVWESWRVPHCDPARQTSPGWWSPLEHGSLAEFLDRVINLFVDPDRMPALRLQMMLGISAMNDRGFVEPRIMMGAAGLEHIMWQTLVLGGRMIKDQYLHSPAHDLLRTVLADARIPTGIDANLLPVTAQFVTDESARQKKALDGADVVTQIRNRLVHPAGAQELVYRRAGLPAEVWRLNRHYLAL
jgi:hypothetical protein